MRLLCVWALMGCVFVANGQSLRGDSWEQTESRKKGTITLAYVETPAFVYKDASGKLTGICVDIMTDFVAFVSKTRKVTLDVNWAGDGIDFKGMYDQVKSGTGGVFGLGNITITDGRKKEVKFSPPYITNFAILITQSHVPMLTAFEDLPKVFTRLTAYTTKGTLDDQRIAELRQKYFPGIRISYTATSQETLEKVTADPNSFAYVDLAYYLKAVQDRKPVKRHPVGDRKSEQFGFVMPLHGDWSPLLEEFFNADGGYTHSLQYKNILTRHLGETGVKLLRMADH